MHPGLLLLLALAAGSDALAPAREALAQGDLARAEDLALAAAAPPQEGAALDVAGAARFRAGRPAEALAAFEAADRAADPPPRGRALFNEAACLEAMGRLPEAEDRYVRAAEAEPSLAALALASAGFAALDAGDRDRARALAERARAAGGAGVSLAEELLGKLGGVAEARRAEAAEAHRAGLAAYDAGRWAEARADFLRAVELDPTSGPSRLMAGAAAARAGDVAEARRLLGEALAMPLDPEEARAARGHLAALDARPPGLGWSGSLHAGGGHDSNVLESGGSRAGQLVGGGPVASAFAAAGLLLRHRSALGAGPDRTLELGYRAEQLAYLAPVAEDYSVQEHTLWIGLALPLARRLTGGVQATGAAAFTGRAHFRPMQGTASLRGWAALGEGGGWSTRLDLGGAAKRGRGSEFAYLTGARWDGALTQALDRGRVGLRAGYAARLEDIGRLTLTGDWPVRSLGLCEGPCTQIYDVPLSYLEQRAFAGARVTGWAGRLELGVSGVAAWRRYLHESTLQVNDFEGNVRRLDPVVRQDRRFTLAAAAVVHPVPRLDLTLSAEYTVVQSNVARDALLAACAPPDYVCHALDYGDANARRTVVGAELGWRW
jgi:tetratricopeptide (TPR) repeat protein